MMTNQHIHKETKRSTQTIEQLQKEIEERKQAIAAEQERLDEAKREADRIEREKQAELEALKRKQAAAANREKYVKHAVAIVKALKAAGFSQATHVSEEGQDFPTIYAFGKDSKARLPITFEYVYARDTWRSRITGVRVQVGFHYDSNTRRYPQGKTGKFNYDKIAEAAKARHQTEVATVKKAESEKKDFNSNKSRVERLASKFGVAPYKGADYKQIPNTNISYEEHLGHDHNAPWRIRKDNDLKLTFQHMTEEDITRILQFMADQGILSKSKRLVSIRTPNVQTGRYPVC